MIRWLIHSRAPRWIVLNFQGMLGSRSGKLMRAHLNDCDECHGIYAAQLYAEQCARSTQQCDDRMEAALFGEPDSAARGISHLRWGLAGAFTLLLAGLLSQMVLTPGSHSPASMFREKGGAAQNSDRYVSVSIYRQTADGFVAVGATVPNDSGLAFAYTNRSETHFDRLLLFAMDDAFNVYWYYPAWADPRRNPAAVSIKTGDSIQLPEAIKHHYLGKSIRVFALFSKGDPATVRDVESLAKELQKAGKDVATMTRFPLGEGGQHSIVLEVKGR